MVEPAIYIRRSNHGGFAVTVEPSSDGGNSASYPDHKSAFGYAVGLRMTHRLPIVDLASDAMLDDILSGGAA